MLGMTAYFVSGAASIFIRVVIRNDCNRVSMTSGSSRLARHSWCLVRQAQSDPSSVSSENVLVQKLWRLPGVTTNASGLGTS